MADSNPRPVYWIEWIDSSTSGGWLHEERARASDLRCWSIGFLVCDDDESVTVAGSCAAQGALLDPITIPKVAITDMREVAWS